MIAASPVHVVLARAGDALCAGVDEAGRGPLAGPVIAAAVILDPCKPVDGLADSKTLSEGRREELAVRIRARASAWALGSACVGEIDALNILNATLLAMQRAVAGLDPRPRHVLVDGNRCPDLCCTADAVVRGDSLVPAISAASILAKVFRDALMRELDVRFPEYGFARHKGYGTAVHLEALRRYGASPEHRRSFAPVRRVLEHGVSD